VAAAFLFILAVVVNVFLPIRSESRSTIETEAELAPAKIETPLQQLECSEDIHGELAVLGGRVESLLCYEGKWRATVRVADAQARARLLAGIARSDTPVSADIYVDTEIAEAAALIAQNLAPASRVVGSTHGVVTLVAIDD